VNRVVVDASFCGALILEDESSAQAEDLLKEALQPGGPTLFAPGLWSYEMLNLVRSAQKRKRLTSQQARKAITLLDHIPIQLADAAQPDIRKRIFQIAITHNLSAYDASYFELADRLKIPLHTNDKALARAYTNR
jgi:predicted nucleic acid-binding protein